jgi:hypothetical protein
LAYRLLSGGESLGSEIIAALIGAFAGLLIAFIPITADIKVIKKKLGANKDEMSIPQMLDNKLGVGKDDMSITGQLGVGKNDRTITGQLGIVDKSVTAQLEDIKIPLAVISDYVKYEDNKREILGKQKFDDKTINDGLDIFKAFSREYSAVLSEMNELRNVIKEKDGEIDRLKAEVETLTKLPENFENIINRSEEPEEDEYER